MTTLLTVDLGTSATKAVLWSERGALAVGRSPVTTLRPEPGRAEQDPDDWWTSTAEACAQVRDADAAAYATVAAIGFSAARETFALVNEKGAADGRAIVWSDRRAGAEASTLARATGGVEALRQRTGIVVDAGCVAAKLAWLDAHEPSRLARARWILSPRDVVLLHTTGRPVTDRTMAAKTACYEVGGDLVPALAGAAAGLFPDVLSPTDVAGPLLAEPADALGLPPGIPVVTGAGDRACEVIGTGATATTAMVSWGTTANLSLPVAGRPDAIPDGLLLTPGAFDGFLLEAGLSAAGDALDWLARLTGKDQLALAEAASRSAPGARDVVALPWFNGARAPWWRAGARAAFVNVTTSHGPGDLARALYESVAFDVARALDVLDAIGRDRIDALTATGGGVASDLWITLLASVCERPVVLRRSGEAASAGACLIAARAIGAPSFDLDHINPVVSRVQPDRALVARYRELRPLADRVASGVIGLDLSEWL